MNKRIDLLDLLNVQGGECYIQRIDIGEVCESINNAFFHLKKNTNISILDGEPVSKWQYNQAIVVLKSLEEGDYENAYHSLWDAVDDRGKAQIDNNYISKSEEILFYSLIQNFYYTLELHKNNKLAARKESKK